MQIFGIIGGVAAGKTTLANIFQQCFKARVFSADNFVHQLYETNPLVIQEIALIVPESLVDAKLALLISTNSVKANYMNYIIDRKILLKHILKDSSILPKIEAIVHPLVIKELKNFLKACLRNHVSLLILDIPLLYKIKADRLCHKILEVKANNIILLQRLQKRYGNVNNFLPKLVTAPSFKSASPKIIKINSGLEKQNLYQQALKVFVL